MKIVESNTFSYLQMKLEKISMAVAIIGGIWILLSNGTQMPFNPVGIGVLSVGGIGLAIAKIIRGFLYIPEEPDWSLVYPEICGLECSYRDKAYLKEQKEKL